ncbi:MAG: cyclic nucleotide-binding domain-containing protein [Chloroflexota bacterium]|nr:cyclic nucleotide-binding domain-containing protein [Chloroflexota bacterium]
MIEEFLEYLYLTDILNEEELQILRPLVDQVSCEAQKTVFEQGEEAKYLYLVTEGEVVIRFNPEDGAAITVSTVGKGDVFGWSSIFGSHTYTSCAVCREDGKLLRIKGLDLKKLCEEHPAIGILILERLASVIASRLKGTQNQVVELLHQGLKNKKL